MLFYLSYSIYFHLIRNSHFKQFNLCRKNSQNLWKIQLNALLITQNCAQLFCYFYGKILSAGTLIKHNCAMPQKLYVILPIFLRRFNKSMEKSTQIVRWSNTNARIFSHNSAPTIYSSVWIRNEFINYRNNLLKSGSDQTQLPRFFHVILLAKLNFY